MSERLPPPILPSEFELVDPDGFRHRFGGEKGRDMDSETTQGEPCNPVVIKAAREIAAGVCQHETAGAQAASAVEDADAVVARLMEKANKKGRRRNLGQEQPKSDGRPEIVAVHFRDVIPGLDMRGLGQRAYKRGDVSWRGYDVDVAPGFVVLTAPAKDGKRAVFRVPESMCVVVTEVTG
jgi:hypothetical protein